MRLTKNIEEDLAVITTKNLLVAVCIITVIANMTILHESISHQHAIERMSARIILTPQEVIQQDQNNTERAFKALQEAR